MIVIITIIAFLLEHLLSNLIPFDSIFLPLFVLSTLILVYPFFYNNEIGYLKYSLIVGILYDVIFTNTLFFNMFIFLLVAFFVQKISFVIIINYINIVLITVITIIIYLILTYFILVIIGYKDFHFYYLLKIIYSSLLANVIYNLFFLFIVERVSKKYKIAKVN